MHQILQKRGPAMSRDDLRESDLELGLLSLQSTDYRHNAGELVWFGHGLVRDMVEEAAELQGILEGLRKAKDHNIEQLVLCAKVSLLEQVSNIATVHLYLACRTSKANDW